MLFNLKVFSVCKKTFGGKLSYASFKHMVKKEKGSRAQ